MNWFSDCQTVYFHEAGVFVGSCIGPHSQASSLATMFTDKASESSMANHMNTSANALISNLPHVEGEKMTCFFQHQKGEGRIRETQNEDFCEFCADITAAVRKTRDFEGLTSEWPFPAGVADGGKMFAQWHWRPWFSALGPLRLLHAANFNPSWHTQKKFMCVRKNSRKRDQKHKKYIKKSSRHTTGFIQKPNYLTLLTLIFFQNIFFKFQFFINR